MIDVAPSALTTAPSVYVPSMVSIAEGETLSTSGWFADAAGKRWSAVADYGTETGLEPLALNGNSFLLTVRYGREGSYRVTIRVRNERGETGLGAMTVSVVESPPSLSLDSVVSYTRDTAHPSWTESVKFYDPSDDHWRAFIDYGDGDGIAAAAIEGHTVRLSHAYPGNGTFMVKVTIVDDEGATATASQQLNVSSPSSG